MNVTKLFKRLMAHAGIFGAFIDEPAGGGGAPAPAPAPRAPEPETFSREYVSELRGEAKGLRLKLAEQEGHVKSAKAEAERIAAEAQTKITEAATAAERRVIRAELKAEALKAGMIDLDGLQLADLTAVKLDDKGEVVGGSEAIEALKKAKPYLFGTTSTSNPQNAPPKPGQQQAKKVSDMTPAEYAAAKKAALKA